MGVESLGDTIPKCSTNNWIEQDRESGDSMMQQVHLYVYYTNMDTQNWNGVLISVDEAPKQTGPKKGNSRSYVTQVVS